MSDGPGRKPTVSDNEILEIFRCSEDPVLTASEVSQDLSIGRRATLKRLQKLSDEGILRNKEIGSGGRVWWLPGSTETSNR